MDDKRPNLTGRVPREFQPELHRLPLKDGPGPLEKAYRKTHPLKKIVFPDIDYAELEMRILFASRGEK